MLLAIDVGNTNIVLGLFAEELVKHQWRISTDLRHSSDEYQAIFKSLAQSSGITLESEISAVIIASVVPQITRYLVVWCRRWLKIEPMLVSVALELGLPIHVREPERVGVDRLLNAVAACKEYGAPCIVLDMGTATKFDVVDGSGAFVGGAIAPGLHNTTDALVQSTSLLPQIEFLAPPSAIGDDTISAMQSGIVFGYISLIEGLLTRIRQTLPEKQVPVVATGGLASVIRPLTAMVDYYNPSLTLEGLRLVYERNKTNSNEVKE